MSLQSSDSRLYIVPLFWTNNLRCVNQLCFGLLVVRLRSLTSYWIDALYGFKFQCHCGPVFSAVKRGGPGRWRQGCKEKSMVPLGLSFGVRLVRAERKGF